MIPHVWLFPFQVGRLAGIVAAGDRAGAAPALMSELEARAAVAQDSVELLAGGAINTLGTAAGILRTVFLVLVARLAGDSALGTFSLAWAAIDLASKVGGLGLGLGIVPEVARVEARGDTESRPLLLTALSLGVVSSTLLAALMIGAVLSLGEYLLGSPQLARAVVLMALALPGVVAYRISNGFSRGLRIMSHNVYSRGLTEGLVTLSVFLTLVALGGGDLAPVWALVVGVTASAGVACWLAWRAASGANALSWERGRRLAAMSLPVAGYGLVNLLILRLDVLLLGAFVGQAPGLDLATFGAYCAAAEIASVMRRVRQTFEPIYVPVIARRLEDGAGETVRGVLAQMGRWSLAVQLPLAGVLVISGGLILRLLGPTFVVAAPWLALLVIASGLANFFGLAEAVFLARYPGVNLVHFSVALAVQLLLTLVLVPIIGVLGAPLAMIAAQVVLGGLRVLALRRRFALAWPVRSLIRPLAISGAAIAAGVVTRSLVVGAAGLTAAAVLLIGFVAGGWWLVGLDAGDRATLSALRRQWRRRSSASTVVP